MISYEVDRWGKLLNRNSSSKLTGFIYLMVSHPEFRNLFYYRAGRASLLFSCLCPRMKTLYIETAEIGPGLFIQHGFATIIAARSIGKDCWINQQVTIGYSNTTDCPVLKDNVVVNAGAKIIGGVTVNANSIVGANAVVVKDVPENCTVVGVPAYIIRKNGIKTKEAL